MMWTFYFLVVTSLLMSWCLLPVYFLFRPRGCGLKELSRRENVSRLLSVKTSAGRTHLPCFSDTDHMFIMFSCVCPFLPEWIVVRTTFQLKWAHVVKCECFWKSKLQPQIIVTNTDVYQVKQIVIPHKEHFLCSVCLLVFCLQPSKSRSCLQIHQSYPETSWSRESSLNKSHLLFRCSCGQAVAQHTSIPVGGRAEGTPLVQLEAQPAEKWNPLKHTQTSPTDAYGIIEFQGGGQVNKAMVRWILRFHIIINSTKY